jgi:hypothetical protein
VPFAFDEFPSLAESLGSPLPRKDQKLWYVASLMAELCYYHVESLEIDSRARAKIIPCDEYQRIVLRGIQTNVLAYLQAGEFAERPIFVIVDRGVVAIGLPLKTRLFIGFRGTLFLYDWRINLLAQLISIGPNVALHPDHTVWMMGRSRFHRGFFEEAFRIAVPIREKLKNEYKDYKEVVLCGHSLGGAVAALCSPLLRGPDRQLHTLTLGAPRYCDAAALYYAWPEHLPIQIKRWGDMVPSIPPRSLGYADCPCEFNTSGKPAFEALPSSELKHFLWNWALFINKRVEPHSIEGYPARTW